MDPPLLMNKITKKGTLPKLFQNTSSLVQFRELKMPAVQDQPPNTAVNGIGLAKRMTVFRVTNNLEKGLFGTVKGRR